jgi:endonuclease YncB( thermonuclease family)
MRFLFLAGVNDSNWGNYVYEAVQSWSSFGSYYGTFYDEFSYSDSDRKIVDSYIKNKLLNVNTRNMHQKGQQSCDPNDIEKTINGLFNQSIDSNTCGSAIWKITLAQLLVGLRLNDEALFKKGIENTKWQLSFFDDTGIFTSWAIKGSAAYQYSSSIPIMLGGLTEIFASIGYDFMEHKLRNGLSIKEVMDRQYEIFLDPHILDSYVKKYPVDYKGTPNAVYLNSSAEEIRNENKDNLFVFVRNLPRYIDTYRADIGDSQEFDRTLLDQPESVSESVAWKSLGAFQPMDPYLAYKSSIEDLCKGSLLNGEYIASWFAASTNDDVGWEFVGSEGLSIECWKGRFEAVEDFQPEDWFMMSKALRKDLNVSVKPDGTINISGDLDLDYSEIERINIKSKTQGGEISGDFNPGWLLKVEINSSKTENNEIPKVTTSDSDPTVSKVIEVIQGDKFIVDIAEPHELAGTNINLNLRDVDAPDAVKSCPKQLEFGNQVKDFVTQKIAGASSLKITNFRKTSKAIIGQVIIDGMDLGAMLIQNGYASDEYGYWKGYFCSALNAIQAGISNEINGDYEESIFWYERALIIDPDGSNNSQATYALSKLYRASGDDKKSLGYLKQSADLNYIEAQEDLGSAYLNGIGVSKNLAQAKKWLKKAHDNGSKNAENICGCEF